MGRYPGCQIYIIIGSFRLCITAQCPPITKKGNCRQIYHPE